jgi:hypothetical protein
MNEYQLGGSLSLITALGKPTHLPSFYEPAWLMPWRQKIPQNCTISWPNSTTTILICGVTIKSWLRTDRNGWTQGSSRMLKKSASVVLASFRPSTYPRGYASALHSLRPCWTAFLSILLTYQRPTGGTFIP